MNYRYRKESLVRKYQEVAPKYYKGNPPQGYTSEEISAVERKLNISFPDMLRFGLQLLRFDLFCGFSDTFPVQLELDAFPANKEKMLNIMREVNYNPPFDIDQLIVYAIWKEGMGDGSYPEVYHFINATEGENPLVYTFTHYWEDHADGPVLLQKLCNGPRHMTLIDVIEYTLTGMSL